LSSLFQHVIAQRLFQPGERIGVAVSGGADSVALLRLLLEARDELGIILTVVHFNHGIRGAESDADEAFVRDLARKFGLEFVVDSADTPAYAKEQKLSLETAARRLRYDLFARLTQSKASLDTIATAHTMDDQAETVLMRLLRGAGTRGLAGIYPEQKDLRLVRPLLGLRRTEIEAYLRAVGQDWREDASNRDVHHTRNRIRHELLPLLARDYNPGIVESLARTADVARAEEEYWQAETARLLPIVLLEGRPVRGGGRATSASSKEIALSIEVICKQPVAVQRRLLRAAADRLNIELDVEHVETVLHVAAGKAKACELPGGWRIERTFRELRFVPLRKPSSKATAASDGYSYPFNIPGRVSVPEMNIVVQARLESLVPATDRGRLLPEPIVISANRVVLRNWQPGDRFQPAHAGSERKVKDLLQSMRLEGDDRRLWPVLAWKERVIWVRGTRPRNVLLERGDALDRVIFECTEQATN
jgi:tRNA(Ile)-lysidine synthase